MGTRAIEIEGGKGWVRIERSGENIFATVHLCGKRAATRKVNSRDTSAHHRLALFLQEALDGRKGTSGDVYGYRCELDRFADC